MDSLVSSLTQSKYYSPAFNAAIFDGPIRIYFAQYQEPQALRIYFRLQEQLKANLSALRDFHHIDGRSVFIMLYPSADSFKQVFDRVATLRVEPFGRDFILGVIEEGLDDEFEPIYNELSSIIGRWQVLQTQPAVEQANL